MTARKREDLVTTVADDVLVYDPGSEEILAAEGSLADLTTGEADQPVGSAGGGRASDAPARTLADAPEWVHRVRADGAVRFPGEYDLPSGEAVPVDAALSTVTVENAERTVAVLRVRDDADRQPDAPPAVESGPDGATPFESGTDGERSADRDYERLDALFSNSQAAIVEYVFRDGEPVVENVNSRFESIFGYDREQVLGNSVDEFIVPPDGRPEAEDLNEKVRNGEYLRSEVQRRTADGVRTFIVRNAPIDTADEVRGYASYTDITERKERERDMQRQNNRLRALFANSQAAIVEYVFRDDEPLVVDVNARFEEIFGYDGVTVVGQSVDEFIVPPENRDVATDLNRKVKRGEYLHTEVQRQTADGVRTFILRNAPIETEDGVRGYAAYTDISERKRRERQLEAQNERLEKFAHIVSHDLRNPLNVAKGHVSMMDGERARTVQDNLDRMEAIIGDVLALAREGRSVDETESTDLAALARQSWDQVATADATLASPDALTVEADPGRCRQLFENLFRNSVEHAGTDVSVRLGATEHGFYLEDDGPGIPPGERNNVFDAGFSTDEDGTGFGLNIVREIAQAHGWTVAVTDGSDGGARFEFGECTVA